MYSSGRWLTPSRDGTNTIAAGQIRARLLELGASGIREVSYEDTEHFKVTRTFLLRREPMLRQLFAEDDPDTEWARDALGPEDLRPAR